MSSVLYWAHSFYLSLIPLFSIISYIFLLTSFPVWILNLCIAFQ